MNHKLAEKYYRARIEELRELIIAEETNFKYVVARRPITLLLTHTRALVSEIEDIRNGFQDSEITNRVPEVGQEPENKVFQVYRLPISIHLLNIVFRSQFRRLSQMKSLRDPT